MLTLENKHVLVIGLDNRGRAACELAHRGGATVVAMDGADSATLREESASLASLGVDLAFGASSIPNRDFSLAVVSSAAPQPASLIEQLRQRKIPILGELEFGFQRAKCLCIAIAGTNGKGTTAELVE